MYNIIVLFILVYLLYLTYFIYVKSDFFYILKYVNIYSEMHYEVKHNPPYNDKYLFIPRYIEYKIKKNAKLQNNNATKIIVSVLSSPHNFRKRYSFRHTYKKYNLFLNSKVIFFIGSSKYDDKRMLNLESSKYNDTVQFSFQNSYLNLTLLSIMALKYCFINFKNINYYIKTDDDMLINYKLLFKLINYTSPYNNIIYGHLQRKKKVIRNNQSLNYIPFSQYPYEYMPKYVYGGLIIVTKKALIKLYNKTLQKQNYYVWREDMNLGILSVSSKCIVKQFPLNIDIKINYKNCTIAKNIIAAEIKSHFDAFYCM